MQPSIRRRSTVPDALKEGSCANAILPTQGRAPDQAESRHLNSESRPRSQYLMTTGRRAEMRPTADRSVVSSAGSATP
jgi:hypothetical protein